MLTSLCRTWRDGLAVQTFGTAPKRKKKTQLPASCPRKSLTSSLAYSWVKVQTKSTDRYRSGPVCCFNQDNPHLSAFEHHAEQGASISYRVHWNSPNPNPLDYLGWIIITGMLCWKSTINYSHTPRREMSWKLPCKPPAKFRHSNVLTLPTDWLPTCFFWLMMVKQIAVILLTFDSLTAMSLVFHRE